MRRHAGWWRRALAGWLMGVGCVLPGISAGVMAVSFGLYQPMLESLLGFGRDWRRHTRFLLPLALGGAVGLAAGAYGIGLAMERLKEPMLYLFTGCLLGGIPRLMEQAQDGGRFHAAWLASLGLGVALALPMALMNRAGEPQAALSTAQWLACGVLEGVGTVVPGVSTSFVLMALGWYPAYLRALATMDFGALAPAAVSFAVSALLSMKAVKWLFDHARGHAYYAVLGFLVVSVGVVFPGISISTLAGWPALVLGAWASARLSRMAA